MNLFLVPDRTDSADSPQENPRGLFLALIILTTKESNCLLLQGGAEMIRSQDIGELVWSLN